jgi:DHA2 family multidrug resistance protein
MSSPKDVANRIPITGALMLATLMNTLDSTIANVALPHIQGSVSASQDQVTWVLTSYILATAIMMPLSGWMAEKIGRRRMFILSIGGFTIASMLCGIATSLPEIVLFRVLQGLAGATLMPLSQMVMLDLFEPKQIPRVMSLWSAAVIMGPIVGPSLGGWLTESLSWRWVFFINLPIGILALMIINLYMDKDPGGRQRPFDFIGFGTLSVFLAGFQLLLDRGPSQDWFDSMEIWFYALLALMGLYLFIVQTLTAEHPFFPRELGRDWNFAGGVTVSFFVGVLLFSTSAILPSFMQNLLGYSALQSGNASMVRGIGSLIAFIFMPSLLARLGAKLTLTIGVMLSAISLYAMANFDLSMTAMPIMTSGFVQGLGVGLMFAPLSTLSFATLPRQLRPEGTSLSTMARSLGSSVGISIVQATFVRQAFTNAARLGEHVSIGNPLNGRLLPAGLSLDTAMGQLVMRGQIARQGAMISYDYVFAWMAPACLLLLPLIFVLKRPPADAPPPEPVGE